MSNTIFIAIFSLFLIYSFYIANNNRCCYNCDFDDDFTLLGCPVCPNGYPCIYPCYSKC